MKQIHMHDIKYYVSKADLQNQNPVEGIIRELRCKQYRTMIRKRVPEAFQDYGLRQVSEISSIVHSFAGSIEGSIPLTNVMGETVDISEYLDFSFYDKVQYKDNAGTSLEEPARWLGVSHRIRRLICHNVLTQHSTVILRLTVQRVTKLEKTTASIKNPFEKFNTAIQSKLKCINREYVRNKLNSDNWADLLEEDEDFRKEFQNIYNNLDICEADDYTPEVLEDTYLNMEIVLPRDDKGSEFVKVTKRL